MIMALILILGIVYFFMKKNKDIFKTIGIGVASALVGAALVFFFFKPKPETNTVFIPGKVELRDTCMQDNIVCTLTTNDSLSIYEEVKAGRYKKRTIKPKLESAILTKQNIVSTMDTTYTGKIPDKPLLERTYTYYKKVHDTHIWDTVTVEGEILDWQRVVKTDTTIKVKEKITNTTAVIEQGADDSKTQEYLPVEVNSSYIGVSLERTSPPFGDPHFDIGLTFDKERWSVGVDKNTQTKLLDPKGYGIKVIFKPFKIKSKVEKELIDKELSEE